MKFYDYVVRDWREATRHVVSVRPEASILAGKVVTTNTVSHVTNAIDVTTLLAQGVSALGV
jgi:hypothetical protein